MAAGPIADPACSFIIAVSMSAMPATRRMTRRPAPGPPRANVENNRRKVSPLESQNLPHAPESPIRVGTNTLSRELEPQ